MNDQQQALFNYCLRVADSSLILGHRLGEWCGHGPILEEDIAMTNIALDLVGQARLMYLYAAQLEGAGKTEDDLAYVRKENEYVNALLVEQPNGDFAQTMMRQLLFSTFCLYYYDGLTKSADETIAAFANKSLKEVRYHVKHSSDWVLRMGDGTEESHQRAQQALENLWPYTGDMFAMDSNDTLCIEAGIAVDLEPVKAQWQDHIKKVLSEATLTMPEQTWMQSGSKDGVHSEHLGYILTDLQYMQRAYPNSVW